MATVYLHIGLPKTGTTTIQHFLWDNTALLEKHGICYPDFGLRYTQVSPLRNAHFLALYPRETTQSTWEAVLNQIAEFGKRFDKILLSDELLWRIGYKNPKLFEQFKTALAERGIALRLIAYLRRQDSFLLSIYRQRIRGGHTSLPFYEYLDSLKEQYPLDFYSYMDRLSGLLGRDHLYIRIYENGQFQGPEHSLHSDFLDIFGLTLADGFAVEKGDYNTTLDDTHLELCRILNTLSEPYHSDPIFKKAFKVNVRNSLHPSEKTSFFRPGEQSAYLSSFDDSNRRLAEEFLGREDGVLFFDDSNTELPEYQVETADLLQETIRFYARTTRMLEMEICELQNYVPLYRLRKKLTSLFGGKKSSKSAAAEPQEGTKATDILS